MIVTVIGDVGSGKSYGMVEQALEYERKGYHIYANFTLKNIKNSHFIEKQDVVDRPLLDGNVENQQYWKEYFCRPCFVMIDEAQGWTDSRTAMSKSNRVITRWFSQIRKIFGGDEDSFLIFITQIIGMIDLRARKLSQYIIEFQKVQKKPLIFLKTTFKVSNGACWKELLEFNINVAKHYDTHEIIL